MNDFFLTMPDLYYILLSTPMITYQSETTHIFVDEGILQKYQQGNYTSLPAGIHKCQPVSLLRGFRK